MMRPVQRFFAILLGVLTVAQVQAQQLERAKTVNFQIPSDVVSSGGGDGAKSTNYILDDTIGEANIGLGRSNNYDLNAGYRQPDGGTFLSLTCGDLTNMGTITLNGQVTGENTCTVITDNDAGYSLSWSVATGSGGTNTGHLISTTPPHTANISPFDVSRTGLVGYWKMEEAIAGSTIKDYSGNGNNGTPFGTSGANNKPQPSASVPSNMNVLDTKSLNLDGTDDYVSIPDANSLDLTNAFTVSLWFKSEDLSQTSRYVLSKLNNAGTNNAYALIFEYVNNTVEFYASGYTGSDPRPGSQISVADTNWHHIVYVYNGSTWAGYLDGTSVFSVSRTFSLPATTGNFFLGSFDGTGFFGHESLDEVRMYNRALSVGEIQALSNAPHTWSVASNKSAWGARLRSSSTDADSKWGTDSSSEKWLNVGDGSYSVASRTSRTAVAGSTQIFQYRTEVGATTIQQSGLYETTVTLTASSL